MTILEFLKAETPSSEVLVVCNGKESGPYNKDNLPATYMGYAIKDIVVISHMVKVYI